MLTSRGERIKTLIYARGISDPEYLKRAWINKNVTNNDFFLNDVVRQFFDDTRYAEDPGSHIGKSLVDQDEVTAVRRMVTALERLMEVAGYQDMTDADYLRTPEWTMVHDAANNLHSIFTINDMKMGAG